MNYRRIYTLQHVKKIISSSIGHIVAVDSVSPTVFCISEAGELVKWFDCSDYMREPSDIAISGKDYFVCDFKVQTCWHNITFVIMNDLLLTYLMQLFSVSHYCRDV